MIDVDHVERAIAEQPGDDVVVSKSQLGEFLSEIRQLRLTVGKLRNGKTIAEICAGMVGKPA